MQITNHGWLNKVTQQPRALRAMGFLSVALVYGLWWLVTEMGWVRPLFLPKPVEVVEAASDVGWDLFHHLWATLLRVLSGFATGSLVGIAVGLMMAYDRRVDAALHPIVESWRPVPPVALMPFFLLWFGFSFTGQWLLVSVGCALVMVVATAEAARNVRPIYVRAAASLGATKWQVFRTIIRPAILPDITSSLRVALALSVGLTIVSEFMGVHRGMGYLLSNSKRSSKTHGLILCVIILGIMSWSLDALVRALMRRYTRWTERADEAVEEGWETAARTGA